VITPYVKSREEVRFEIFQEIHDLGEIKKIGNSNQPIIRTKSIKTTVLARDQQIVIIGGLTHHRKSKIEEKVPFLGDLPILGWFFKNVSSKIQRRNLVLMFTATLIKNKVDEEFIYKKKLREREAIAYLFNEGSVFYYNPDINYDQKVGPLRSLINVLDADY